MKARFDAFPNRHVLFVRVCRFAANLGLRFFVIRGNHYQFTGGGIASDEPDGIVCGHFDIVGSCGQAGDLVYRQLPGAIQVINAWVNLARDFHDQAFRNTAQGAGEIGRLADHNRERVYGDIWR